MAGKNTRSSKKKDATTEKPAPVTPVKPPAVKPKKFSLVVLNNGKNLPFKSLLYSGRYEKANATVISAVHRFHTAEEMETFQTKLEADKKPTAVKRPNDSILTPDQKESLARMKKIKTTRHPHKAITLHYKTTPFSSACGIILDIVDYNGNTQWNFKASDHKENLQAYIECVEDLGGTYTRDLIVNLKLAQRRDLTKSDGAGMKNKGGYEVCKMMTFFVLPESDPSLSSEEAEKDFIERELHAFGNELKGILTSPLYNEAMKDHVAGYSDKFLDTLYSPKKGPTLPDFIGSCTVLVQPIKNVGEHIIKAKEAEFEDIIHHYDNPIPKFITDEDALQAENETGYSSSFSPTGGPAKQKDSEKEVENEGQEGDDQDEETES